MSRRVRHAAWIGCLAFAGCFVVFAVDPHWVYYAGIGVLSPVVILYLASRKGDEI